MKLLSRFFPLALVVFFAACTKSKIQDLIPDKNNGGITLPEQFGAVVVVDSIGRGRHMAINSNGDIYLHSSRLALDGKGIIALRDTSGDGHADIIKGFSDISGTGIELHNGFLYYADATHIFRSKLTDGELLPSDARDTMVTMVEGVGHMAKTFTFDDKDGMYVNIGSMSNCCEKMLRMPHTGGADPCVELETRAGIWKFDENKPGQTQEMGTRFATGLRQFPAIAWHDGALYIAMNNRDQLDQFWPDKFTAKDNAERPAEPLYRAVQGSNFGWPYCFFDYGLKKFLLNPEYGGDGKEVGRCTEFTPPGAAFPAHWAPVDLMFYSGTQFPKKYQAGVFIAFHGSWNRAPMPQAGYNVTFQPFANGKPSGDFEVFAQGFAGKDPLMNPGDAVARADGVAQAPDGSLYIAESQKGKIWRVIYKGAK